jgi:hypothetical protein
MLRIAIAVVVLAAPAVGCGDDQSSADAGPPDAAPPGGSVSLSWTISDGTSVVDCEEVGGVTVRVTATPVEGGSATIESFTCTSGSGTSSSIAPGTYDIAIDLRASGNRSLLSAPLEVEDVDISLGQASPIGQFEFDVVAAGSFRFTITAEGEAQNCPDAEIVAVEFELADDDGNCVEAQFDIAAGASQPARTYTTSCTAPAPLGFCIERDQLVSVASTRSGAHSLAISGQKAGPLDCWLRSPDFTIPGNNLDFDLMQQLLTLEAIVGCDPTVMP